MFTKEEKEAILIQLGYRIDWFKNEAIDSENYERIKEITDALRPLESAYKKIQESPWIKKLNQRRTV